MDTVIEVEGLRKEYRRVRGGRTVAVDGLDLAVPRGGVFGWVSGPGSSRDNAGLFVVGSPIDFPLLRALDGRSRPVPRGGGRRAPARGHRLFRTRDGC